jgi:hypothetical protein
MLGHSSDEGIVAHVQLCSSSWQLVGFGNCVLDWFLLRLQRVSRRVLDKNFEGQLTLFLLDGREGELVGVSASSGPWLVSSRLVR